MASLITLHTMHTKFQRENICSTLVVGKCNGTTTYPLLATIWIPSRDRHIIRRETYLHHSSNF